MINDILTSLLYRNSPADLKLILVDPKQVEMKPYDDIPHLLTPVLTEPEKCISALKWAVAEMERRYKALADERKRNIEEYNKVKNEEGMPYIVIVIDELADLMMMAARDVEALIVRIAQKARAVGIHLVLATQRPSVDVITGLIKANGPHCLHDGFAGRQPDHYRPGRRREITGPGRHAVHDCQHAKAAPHPGRLHRRQRNQQNH
jgi:S-DNA-T family DNA segregation ATPase FtsK/SpoIIIE